MTHLKVGDEAPEINAVDQNGELLTLSQFKGKKGNLIFLSKRYDTRLYNSIVQLKR